MLRLGNFESRRGHWDAALAEFDRVSASDDRVIRYWLHLFRGQALSRVNRSTDAIEAYRRACEEFPYAQSATIALGTLLVANGNSSEAREMVTRLLTMDAQSDPWRVYKFPAYRHWPALVHELRLAMAP